MRHLIELLDGAVEQSYVDAGLDYRPRYTPIMRALLEAGPLTVGEIAQRAGITQPAATQTVGLMSREGWVTVLADHADARRKRVQLSDMARQQLPLLQSCWAATAQAARSLEMELTHPLQATLSEAISALEARSFSARIAAARTCGNAESGVMGNEGSVPAKEN